MTTVATQPEYRCDEAEARALTDAIKEGVEKTYRRLLQAHRWRAWSALGYASWRDYAQAEFGMSQSYAYRLLDTARVVEEIEAAVGSPMGEITEREARDLKPHLPAVIEAVREATADVPDDEKPAAAAEAIRAARAHVTTTTRTTEATKVEQDVDTNTGEILTDDPGKVTKLTGHNSASDPSDSPAAIAAKAMSEARNSPWQVFSVKLLGSLVQWGDWLRRDTIGGPAGLIADLNAQPYSMPEADESILRTLADAKAWITEIEQALTDRKRHYLRSVQ